MKFLFRKTFIFSLCCHLFCFSLVGFALPKIHSKDYEVRFLGSFLSNIDFLNPGNFISNSKYERVVVLDNLFIDKTNISINKAYLLSNIEKPIIENGLSAKFFLTNYKKNDIIEKENLKSSLIYNPEKPGYLGYFKNNTPSNFIKVKLDIEKNGRVAFVERIEGSGDLEQDLLIRRYCLDYIFSPGFSKELEIKKINLSEFSNV